MVKIIRPQRLELASIKGGRDITRPYFGKMLEPLDSVLAGQGRDYQVYEELLKDSQVHSCFQQLSDRISECETTVLPGGERPIDLAAAEAFELVLKTIGWDDLTKRMAYARIFGFSVAEVLWGVGGSIDCIKVRSQRRFKFDEDLNLRLLTMTNSYEGEELPCRKFWHLSMGGWRSDEPYGLGLGHQLYWPVYFKKNGVLSWLRFLEKYGHPLPLVRHAEGATDDQKREAIYLAQSLAEDSAAAGSENLTFDLIESSRNGTADYTQLVQTMDAQIAKIILSQGMTTDNGSSRAQADVHNGVADSIVKSMSDLICESFNKSIVTWWAEFNFPGAKPPQVWRRTEPESDLVAIVARDKTLSEMGFPPTAEYIIETYGEGFRPPERGDDAPIALNGAQVTALTTTISQAISDGWIPELAVATIRASFPTIGADLITAIAEQLQAQVDKSAELAKPQEAIVSPEQAAAMFAETVDYAGKKGSKGGAAHNCKKGKTCKGRCINKDKTCLGDMNPQQLAAHKAAQKAAKKIKGGGGGATPDPVAVPAKPIDKDPNGIPLNDPYDKSLSTFNALGVERSYAGVDQTAGNSRLFMARDIIKNGTQQDIDTFMKDQYLYHFESVKNDGSKFSDRANYEFRTLWDKTSPSVRQELADEFKGKNPLFKKLSADDLEASKVAKDKAAKAEEAAYLAKKAEKAAAKKTTEPDGLDGLFGDVKPAKPIDKNDIPDAVKETIAAKVPVKKDAMDQMLDDIPDPPKTKDSQLYKKAENFLADKTEPNVAAKIDRIRTEFPNMTKGEAHAIATWIGDETTTFAVKKESIENFRAMNMAYYNPKGLPAKQKAAIDATNQLLESAYKKLPPPTIGYITEKSLGKIPPVVFTPENNLTRNLEFKTPAQTKAFLQKYQDSIGKEVIENYHLAATHLKKLDWAEKDANVQLSIKPRYGENGQARYVDHFKNQMSEGELIYPPGSKFKVLGIREINPMKDSVPASIAKLPAKSKDFAVMLSENLGTSGVKDAKTWEAYKKGFIQKGIETEGVAPANIKALKVLQGLSFAEIQQLQQVSKSPQKKYIIDMEEN